MIMRKIKQQLVVTKYWVHADGTQIGAGESHETAALRILPKATVERLHGDYPHEEFEEAIYSLMFARKYMRVSIMHEQRVSVFVDAPFARVIAELSQPQRDWVAAKVAAGNQLQFNNTAYVESRYEAPKADAIVETLLA